MLDGRAFGSLATIRQTEVTRCFQLSTNLGNRQTGRHLEGMLRLPAKFIREPFESPVAVIVRRLELGLVEPAKSPPGRLELLLQSLPFMCRPKLEIITEGDRLEFLMPRVRGIPCASQSGR